MLSGELHLTAIKFNHKSRQCLWLQYAYASLTYLMTEYPNIYPYEFMNNISHKHTYIQIHFHIKARIKYFRNIFLSKLHKFNFHLKKCVQEIYVRLYYAREASKCNQNEGVCQAIGNFQMMQAIFRQSWNPFGR